MATSETTERKVNALVATLAIFGDNLSDVRSHPLEDCHGIVCIGCTSETLLVLHS